jgi:2-oxoisovalerate dehydrogenase E1 component
VSRYAPPEDWADDHVPLGAGRCYGDGPDLTIVTFGNGVPMSLRVARRLGAAGIEARVLDLRWIAPLPLDEIVAAAEATRRVLVVDETRASGGVSEGVITGLVDRGYSGRVARVAACDTFIPLGDAADQVLVSETAIEKAAHDLIGD